LFQLELQEKNLQLQHYQQLVSMLLNELESDDAVLRKMSSALKEYHLLLQGHNLTTDAMVSNYEVSSDMVLMEFRQVFRNIMLL
jgi:hypothetical protein